MNQVEEEQLKMEIAHIFESGANEMRILEMVKSFNNRPNVIGSVSAHIHYDLSLKAMQLMVDKEELTVEEFRELPEVKKLWLAMDVIKEHYL
jgi:hypothetical protein